MQLNPRDGENEAGRCLILPAQKNIIAFFQIFARVRGHAHASVLPSFLQKSVCVDLRCE